MPMNALPARECPPSVPSPMICIILFSSLYQMAEEWTIISAYTCIDSITPEIKYITGCVKRRSHTEPSRTLFCSLASSPCWDFPPCACFSGLFQVTCHLTLHQSWLLLYLLSFTELFTLSLFLFPGLLVNYIT